MKYIIKCFGWEVEYSAHSITNKKVSEILEIKIANNYSELIESKYEIENQGIISDVYEGSLFHFTKPSDNDRMEFIVFDENETEVLRFNISEMSDMFEYLGDKANNIVSENYLVVPEEIKDVENILFMTDESKGGLFDMLFESKKVPCAKDFFYSPGYIETLEGDIDFISKIFFKGIELKINNYLDSSGKASVIKIFTHDGNIIL